MRFVAMTLAAFALAAMIGVPAASAAMTKAQAEKDCKAMNRGKGSNRGTVPVDQKIADCVKQKMGK